MSSSPGAELPLQPHSDPPQLQLSAPTLLGTTSPRPLSSTLLGKHRVRTRRWFGEVCSRGSSLFLLLLFITPHPELALSCVEEISPRGKVLPTLGGSTGGGLFCT